MAEQNPIDLSSLAAPADAALPQLYVNAVVIRGGAFDVTVDLGHSVAPDSPDQPTPPPQWLARMSMSWEHALAFTRFLDGAIKKYEEQVGQLPDVEKKMREQVQQ